MNEQTKQYLHREIETSANLPDYEAVDVLWLALINAANDVSQAKDERDRLWHLMDRIPTAAAESVLQPTAVDGLLDLDPPLEAVISERRHEHQYDDRARQEIAAIRNKRTADPKGALREVGHVLKRIRNKRAHGFKTREGPRDVEILRASREILHAICQAVVE